MSVAPSLTFDESSRRPGRDRIREALVGLAAHGEGAIALEFDVILMDGSTMQQAARVSDRTAFFAVAMATGVRVGERVEHGVTAKGFASVGDPRTGTGITGRFG